MEKKNIIQALRSEDFLHNLSDQERSLLPENPAGVVELDDASLKLASGGFEPVTDSETYPRPQCCW